MNTIGYITIIGLLGLVVRVSYMVYAKEVIATRLIIARGVISIVVGYIVGSSIDPELQWRGVELYGPIIRLGSFFSVDIVQWLVSDKVKILVDRIIEKNTPPLL